MKTRVVGFIAVLVVCLIIGTGYVLTVMGRTADRSVGHATDAPTGIASAIAPGPSMTALAPLGAAPQLITLSKAFDESANRLQISSLEPDTPAQPIGPLRCERSYFAGQAGICLKRTFADPFRAVVSVTLFGPDFQPLMMLEEEGIPSRARISSDGALAAYTLFVTGHSYTDARLSTKTMLIDVKQRREIANLEDFTVLKDGHPIAATDFNFWGVTFAANGDTFYATLRTAGVNYLVQGEIKRRTMTVLRDGVECPSLSPDGTRLAFKRLNPDQQTWRLHVLDLRTLLDTPMSETRNVDDQAEWFDNHTLLYEMARTDTYPHTDLMSVPADGSGAPRLLLADAGSPSVVRRTQRA